ncbi:MAG: MarR family winged helix-turn-helix transcriptional regulator [Acetobacterium sp.]
MKNDSFIFGKVIKQMNNRFDHHFNIVLKQWNLTSSQFEVIMYLLGHQTMEVNQKQIEDDFKLKSPTVSGIVKRLEEKGFIERHTDQLDRRINHIELTEKSKALEPCLIEEITRVEAHALRDIPDDKIALLNELLNKVMRNITDF